MAHAVRLAAVVRDQAAGVTERLGLFHRVLALEPRVARQVALDVADDRREEVRVAACGVLASTSGSEDDLARLLSLAADERMSGQRQALQWAADAVRTPDPEESVGLLWRLVEVGDDAPRLSLEALVPAQKHRPQLLRWINKAWCRAADHRRSQRFLEAALVLGGIMVDQTVLLAGAGGLEIGVSGPELGQVDHGLRERPTPLQLATREAVRDRYPWMGAYADLAAVLRDASAGRSPRMPVLGARDIANASADLRALASGWLNEAKRRG